MIHTLAEKRVQNTKYFFYFCKGGQNEDKVYYDKNITIWNITIIRWERI